MPFGFSFASLAARHELDLMVRRASDGAVGLADLDKEDLHDNRGAVALLSKIEEAALVDVSERVSPTISVD